MYNSATHAISRLKAVEDVTFDLEKIETALNFAKEHDKLLNDKETALYYNDILKLQKSVEPHRKYDEESKTLYERCMNLRYRISQNEFTQAKHVSFRR